MTPYHQILDRNRSWVDARTREAPDVFTRLAAAHAPELLFIGCSDARVPANVITQTSLGEMFVHRNIANLVVPSDTNLLAIVQYAVDVLRVTDVMVCGHHGCGGVRAAMGPSAPPQVEGWLANIRTTRRLHEAELAAIADEDARYDRLVELNVIEQVYNLSRLPTVQQAWARGATLRLHGCVYELATGRMQDVGISMDGPMDAHAAESMATQSMATH